MRDKNGENPDETQPVVAIGAYAVNADEYAETMVIGASVQRIDKNAFFNLKKLQKITVDPANEWFKDVDGVLFSKDGGTLLLYPACYGQTPTGEKDEAAFPDAYTVPQGTQRIENFAFLKNTHLRDLTLPDTLREIGDMAFFGCSRLGAYEYDAESGSQVGSGFSLPDGLETIGADAFSKCGGIAPLLYLPSSLREIGHHAFFGCAGIKEVLLGAESDEGITLGEAWLPKSIKAGAMWKAPKPRYGAPREESETAIEAYKAEKLTADREEAQKNG